MTARESFGSVRKTSAGRFQARATVDGKQVGIGSFTSLREAKRALARHQTNPAVTRSLATGRVTLDSFAASWFASPTGDVKRPQTVSEYRRIYGVHLAPTLGRRHLIDLTPGMIQRLVNDLASPTREPRPLARPTIKHVLVVLGFLTHAAFLRGLIPTDPVKQVELPSSAPGGRKMTRLSAPQVTLLADALDTAHPGCSLGLVVRTMTFGGALRVGELIALDVADLDVDRGTLSVSRSTRKGITSPPKTEAGVRTIHLPADLVAALAAHVAGRSPSSPLFTTTTGTRLDNSNLLRRVRAAADGLGLPPLRVHDLRHTGISLALSIGVPVADVAKWCGHANAAVTLSVYAGAVPGRESVVADAFAAHSSGVVVPLRSVAS